MGMPSRCRRIYSLSKTRLNTLALYPNAGAYVRKLLARPPPDPLPLPEGGTIKPALQL